MRDSQSLKYLFINIINVSTKKKIRGNKKQLKRFRYRI